MSDLDQDIASVASAITSNKPEDPTISLITEEGEETMITKSEAAMSALITRMLDEDDGESIELANTRK